LLKGETFVGAQHELRNSESTRVDVQVSVVLVCVCRFRLWALPKR